MSFLFQRFVLGAEVILHSFPLSGELTENLEVAGARIDEDALLQGGVFPLGIVV